MECPYCEQKQGVFKFSNICSFCKKEYKIKFEVLTFFLIMFSVPLLTNAFLYFVFSLKASALLKTIISGIAAGVASLYAIKLQAIEVSSKETSDKNLGDNAQIPKTMTETIKVPDIDYDNEVSTWSGRGGTNKKEP